MADPLKYYDLERYLLEEVQPRFHKDGSIGAFDFFSIIIWKANRSKSKIAGKLKSVSNEQDLEEICTKLSKSISTAMGKKEKMRILMIDWRFRLPMASAVLTILYPNDFSVYDYRVAGQVGKIIPAAGSFDKIWEDYSDFVQMVGQKAIGLTLRDRDRYLFGKSRIEDLEQDIRQGFPIKEEKDSVDNRDSK